MSKTTARYGIPVTFRLGEKFYVKAEGEAKEAGKSLSRWAREVVEAELNGENRDSLGDLVRNMPRMPCDPDNLVTCSCGHTRRIPAKPRFVPDGMERPAPEYEDPGCPKCGAGLEGAASVTLQQDMTRDEFARRYPGTPLTFAPGLKVGMTPEQTEEFRRRYPNEKPIVASGESRSWSSEWAAIEQMEPQEAMARFKELRGGRPLPPGFMELPRDLKIAWLERTWPL